MTEAIVMSLMYATITWVLACILFTTLWNDSSDWYFIWGIAIIVFYESLKGYGIL